MAADFVLEVNLVDIPARATYPATLRVVAGRVAAVERTTDAPASGRPYALPGFVDAHVHVESSLLVPSEFARLALPHGTVATVSDPHEIGNVLGVAGVRYMLDNAATGPFKFCFGAPSCVPATPFETAGAAITAADIEALFQDPRIGYLAEMMNWPGVLGRDAEVMGKIALAQRYGRPVDGHAPGLRGAQAARYASAGIATDHECFRADEARDKLAAGMHVLIREGSAARNFDALIELIPAHYERLMFCSDDKHPDTLLLGHIDQLVRRAVALGYDVYQVLQMACLNPVAHYRLPVGQLRAGDPADFILVDNLTDFRVEKTYLDGELVAEAGHCLLPAAPVAVANNFHATPVTAAALAAQASISDHSQAPSTKHHQPPTTPVIECFDGQLITARRDLLLPHDADGRPLPDPAQDVCKLVVLNRYAPGAAPAVAFIKGFGLRSGALASSVGHDSHNITAVGCDDESLARALNLVVAAQGGLSAASPGGAELVLPLPVAGLMSDQPGPAVAAAYSAVDDFAKTTLGSTLQAPFMTLSFMALLVIPSLKLSDLGLFDGEKFEFVS